MWAWPCVRTTPMFSRRPFSRMSPCSRQKGKPEIGSNFWHMRRNIRQRTKMPNAEARPSLSGRIALISGASKGLGRAMALALSEAGASIALVSRDAEKLRNVKEEIDSSGGRSEVFVADVAREENVCSLESDVSDRLGKVQI